MSVKYHAIAIFAVLALAGTLTTANAAAHRTQDSFFGSGSPTLEDNSGHILGPLVDASTTILGPDGGTYTTAEFYSTSLRLIVPVGPAGTPGIPFDEMFTSADCTGTGYFPAAKPEESYASPSSYLTLLAGSGGGYFKLQDTQPVTLSLYSEAWGASCLTANEPDQLVVPVTPIASLPFTTPIALPLQLVR